MKTYIVHFNRFQVQLTEAVAEACYHPGRCDDDVEEALRRPEVAHELYRVSPEDLRDELLEYGAWEEDELVDHDTNVQRLLWIAAGNIGEGDAARVEETT